VGRPGARAGGASSRAQERVGYEGQPGNDANPLGDDEPTDAEVEAYSLLLSQILPAIMGGLKVTKAVQERTGSRGFTGGNSKTVVNVAIGRQKVRVDVEYPTGTSSGNVHNQTKGAGGKEKFYLEQASDLGSLPGPIRSNSDIQRAVERAFQQSEKARGSR